MQIDETALENKDNLDLQQVFNVEHHTNSNNPSILKEAMERKPSYLSTWSDIDQQPNHIRSAMLQKDPRA